jgi:hypothetical protein
MVFTHVLILIAPGKFCSRDLPAGQRELQRFEDVWSLLRSVRTTPTSFRGLTSGNWCEAFPFNEQPQASTRAGGIVVQLSRLCRADCLSNLSGLHCSGFALLIEGERRQLH